MENDINNTLAFDLALQFVPTRTGPVEDAVAQAMERSILHVAVMVCMYLITTALGTLMLFCAGKAKAVPKRKRTSRKDSLSSKTSEDEMAVRVEEEVPDPDDEAKEPDLLQLPISLQYQKAFVVGVYCCNFLLCLAAGVGSTLTGLLSPELGLAWEFYTVHFACGCLWMLAQAALAAYMLPPGRRYANTAFLEATFLGICPVTSDAFDTLKDVSFGFLCFAADNLIVNAVGLISLLWLLMFHAILFRDQAFRQWFAENHVSVLALRTLPADADDSPNPLKIPYSENWPDEVAKMMADKKPTSYFLCTKAGKTIPFVADGAPGELTKTTRVDDADFPIELVCQVQYSDHLAADVKEFMADKSPTSYYLCTRNGKRIPFVADSEPVKLTREPNVDEFPVVFVYQVSWMEWAAGLSAEILQYIYKQLTPLKRKMLLWENLPQGVMACIYLEVVGGSVMVALLNLAVPTVQIICTLALFHPVQRLIVAKFAEQIDIAFQESDLVEFHRLRTEAELDSESGLFREICPHSKRLNGFIPDLDESDEGRRVHEAWARSRWILLDCFDSMRSNPHNAHYGELEIVGELQGKQSTHLEGIVAIFSAFHLEGVEILKMNSNNISSKWSKDLAKGLIRNTTITHLDMSGNHIRAAGTKALLHALGDNDLQFLALCGNDLGLKGAEAVAEYLKKDTTQVEKLLLDDNNFADEGSKVLAEAFKMNQSVRYLHLRGNKIGSAGIQDLLLAVVDNDLLLLALCGNDLGLKGAEAVAKYLKRSDTHVSDLRLDDNNFADEGSEVLAEAFKMNQHVQSLHLRGNKIGSAGIQALSEMLKTNQTLEWFDLSNNNMDLVCLEALATAMSKNRHITELYIFAETKVLMKSPVDSTAYFGSAGESKLIKVLPNELMFVCVTSASKHAWTMIVV
ncbi:unnamed protein product [Durusdinium trenchii]|uniref:Uncharacterized protein n=1 Tax=Durusdinium trenchii TaxID=1381693 RepID=A0ABP0N1J4_9DINO